MASTRVVAGGSTTDRGAYGWRARTRLAFALVMSQPELWLTGAAGFLLRGGAALLVLPMIALPTLVEARLLFGTNLGSTGLTAQFFIGLGVAAVLVGLGLLGALYLLARLEISGFATALADPELVVLEPGPVRLSEPVPARRRSPTRQLWLVELSGLVVLLGGALPLLVVIVNDATSQMVRPSGSGDIYLRVMQDVLPALGAYAALIVLVELVTAIVVRGVLGVGFGQLVGVGRVRLVRTPLATLATALVGWLVSAAAVGAGMLAVVVAWQQARGFYLELAGASDPQAIIGLAIATLLLVLAFIAALVLAGFASAARSALWTVHSLS